MEILDPIKGIRASDMDSLKWLGLQSIMCELGSSWQSMVLIFTNLIVILHPGMYLFFAVTLIRVVW